MDKDVGWVSLFGIYTTHSFWRIFCSVKYFGGLPRFFRQGAVASSAILAANSCYLFPILGILAPISFSLLVSVVQTYPARYAITNCIPKHRRTSRLLLSVHSTLNSLILLTQLSPNTISSSNLIWHDTHLLCEYPTQPICIAMCLIPFRSILFLNSSKDSFSPRFSRV